MKRSLSTQRANSLLRRFCDDHKLDIEETTRKLNIKGIKPGQRVFVPSILAVYVAGKLDDTLHYNILKHFLCDREKPQSG